MSRKNNQGMNVAQYLRLVGGARAFRQTAWLVEGEIRRLDARWDIQAPIGREKGWPSQMVWESLKTASHYNLAVALELGLKCLLHLHGLESKIPHGRKGHWLALLLQLIPEPTATKCQRLFRQAVEKHPFQLIAFCSTKTSKAPNSPNNVPLDTLEDFCLYLDGDAQLWKKRYSWEGVSKSEWRHYLDKLDAFFVFLEETENTASELARKKGLVKLS